MNQWIVPNLNQRQQIQEQVEGEEMNTSPPHHHLQTDQNLTYVVPMDDYEVAELTWENGQLALHGLGTGNNFPCHQTKLPTWSREEENTLESMVHQATFSNSNINISQSNGKLITSSSGKWGEKSSSHSNMQGKQSVGTKSSPIGESLNGKWKENLLPEKNYGSSIDESLGGKREENSGGLDLIKKRVRVMDEEKYGKKRIEVEESESATFFSRDFRDKSMRRFEESQDGSLRNTRNTDDNSVFSENQKEEGVTKGEKLIRSTLRRSHAAATHNQSERRRRDRINEKMKTLQKLVPNASKTDKASMLDEVIEHLKQLQAQIQMMNNARNISQMMMPLGMQQQLQMSLLARMSMGMGMGMGNVPQSLPPLINPATTPLCGATPPFISPSYVAPSVIPPMPPMKSNFDASAINTNVSVSDAYNTFLAQQSMNMDFFNKMSSLYQQKANQSSKNLSHPNDGRGN